MNYRKATIEDIPTLISLRKQQLIDEGQEITLNIDTELEKFFYNTLSDGTLIQYLVEKDNEVIASGTVIIFDFPPSYTNPTGKWAYISNMFTALKYRGQGIAKEILKLLTEEIKAKGIKKVWLRSSEMGRHVYKNFGFKEMDSNMMMDLHI